MEEQEAFVFYPTFFKQLSRMPDAERLAMYDAVAKYGCTGEDSDFGRWELDAIFDPIKVAIDNAKERYDAAVENGKKGGRPLRLTDEQKEMINQLIVSGETFEKIAKIVGCSVSTIYRYFHENADILNENFYQKGGFDKNVTEKIGQNLNIDIDIEKDIDIKKEVEVEKETDKTIPTPTNDTDLLSRLINKSFYLGTQIDEPTAERIISFCEEHLLPDPVGWFQFCWEKTSSKGLLHEKDRDEAKRIVVSAAINKNGKWSYLPEDYQKWYQERHPKAWSSGITLPPKEECVPADQVGQFFKEFKAKKPETA